MKIPEPLGQDLLALSLDGAQEFSNPEVVVDHLHPATDALDGAVFRIVRGVPPVLGKIDGAIEGRAALAQQVVQPLGCDGVMGFALAAGVKDDPGFAPRDGVPAVGRERVGGVDDVERQAARKQDQIGGTFRVGRAQVHVGGVEVLEQMIVGIALAN